MARSCIIGHLEPSRTLSKTLRGACITDHPELAAVASPSPSTSTSLRRRSVSWDFGVGKQNANDCARVSSTRWTRYGYPVSILSF